MVVPTLFKVKFGILWENGAYLSGFFQLRIFKDGDSLAAVCVRLW